MKLILLYGPHCVVKVTVGEQLAERTGFRLFSEHSAVEAATSLFALDSAEFFHTLNRIYLMAFEEAVQANQEGLIFTYIHMHSPQGLVDQLREATARNGSTLYVIELYCDPTTLKNGTASKTRNAQYGTMTGTQLTDNQNDIQGVSGVIPEQDALRINASSLGPEEIVPAIMSYCGLPTVGVEESSRLSRLTRRTFLEFIARWIRISRA